MREAQRARLVTVALASGVFLAALDQTVVATALPTIAGDLHGIRLLPWVVSAYLLTATVATPVAGKMCDLYGYRRVVLAAVGLLVAGSALAGFAGSMPTLVAARAVQGGGGGALGAGAFAAIAHVAGPQRRGQYQAAVGSVFGLASILGAPLGGVFTDGVSWRWIFHFNVVLGLAAGGVVAVLLGSPRTPRRGRVRVDYLGITLITGAVTCLVVVTGMGGVVHPWNSPVIVGAAVAGAVFIAFAVAVESRVPEPLIPPSLLGRAGVMAATVIGLLTATALFGVTTFLPVFLQLATGYRASVAGLLLAPFMATVVVVSLVAGRAVDRTGRIWPFPVVGTAIAAAAAGLLSTMGAYTPFPLAIGYTIVFGLGIGMVMQIVVLLAQTDVGADTVGTATSTVLFGRTVGSLAGAAVSGAVFNAWLGDAAVRPGGVDALGPASLDALAPARQAVVRETFADATSAVFIVCACCLVGACLMATVHAVRARQTADLRSHTPTGGRAPTV